MSLLESYESITRVVRQTARERLAIELATAEAIVRGAYRHRVSVAADPMELTHVYVSHDIGWMPRAAPKGAGLEKR